MHKLLPLCLLATPALFAQWDGSSRGITVHVEFESSAALGPLHYFAEISSAHDSMPGRRVPIEEGSIDFNDVSPGINTIRVCDQSGATITAQPFQAERGIGPVRITIPGSHAERPPSGTVSLHRLQHPLGRKTLHEMQEAVKYLAAKEDDRAMEHLEKALAMEPHLPEAHSWQGALFLRKGDLARADLEMHTAEQQGMRDATLYVNLGVLEVMKHDLQSATRYAEAAIRLQPSNPQAQRLLQRLRPTP